MLPTILAYFTCSGVSLSILTFIAFNASTATCLSISSGTVSNFIFHFFMIVKNVQYRQYLIRETIVPLLQVDVLLLQQDLPVVLLQLR